MRKQKVVEKVARRTLIEQQDVELIINAMMEVIKEEVGKGQRIDFRGFGSFLPKVKKAKIARDILRNRALHIPERIEPSFRHSKKHFTINSQQDV